MTEVRGALVARESPLAIGEVAPGFTLPAAGTGGEVLDVSLVSVLKEGPVLLVFYQDDGMPICTAVLGAFAQEQELLAGAGIRVFGINTNGTGSHQRFQERDRYPFPLLSDFSGEVVRAYGMWEPDEAKSRRGVVAIGPDGRVVYVLPHFNPGSITTFAGVFEALGLA